MSTIHRIVVTVTLMLTAGAVSAPVRAQANSPGARASGPAASSSASVAAPAPALRSLAGAGIPSYAPINPTSASRSGLYASPLREATRSWRFTVDLDYASAAEWEQANGDYVLDAELMRTTLTVQRDLGARSFVTASANVDGAYNGFADSFFTWYHGLIKHHMEGRTRRPENEFAYYVYLPDGDTVVRAQPRAYLGDARVEVGLRFGDRPHAPSPSVVAQTVLSVTLPTSTGPEGYGRGVPSINGIGTVVVPLWTRALYQGSVGLGYTPAHGALSNVDHVVFGSMSSGVRIRAWRNESLFVTAFAHTPYYRGTRVLELDSPELTFDFGLITRTAAGRDWHIALTEDIGPRDPGVDLTFRIGSSW
jgi:hypothetical protein